MAILVFVVFGAMAYFSMPLNLMPDVNLPFVVIQTVYPGAGPSEVETQVTKRIEDAITTVSMVDYTQSYSLENVSIIIVAFKMQKNADIANQEIKDTVDGISRDLPASAERPLIRKLDYNAMPFMDIVLSGNLDGRELYELAETKLKDRFGQIAGVGEIAITGGNKRQIEVNLDEQVVFQNRISMAQLMQVLAGQNLDMPAGNFKSGSQEYSVHLKGQFESRDAHGDADIPTATGFKKLRDLAEITDGAEEVRSRAIYYNIPTKNLQDNIVRLSVTSAPDGNVVSIAKEVKKELPGIRETLPEGAKLDVVRDDSDFIKGTVNDTFTNIWMGIILTGLILLLFLHDARSTLIVGLSMPVSIISTLMFLKIAGFSFNLLTLIGISTSVGILVTNSVVVIENIFRYRDAGLNRREAAARGTSEIALPVLASTLTNIVVFIPIALMGSLVGQFFREFALTVAFATIFSLITAFTLTPMLASRIIPEDVKKHKFGLAFDKYFGKFAALYKRFLGSVLSSKKRSRNIIFIAVAILLASFLLIPAIGIEFIPEMDQAELSIRVELPQGYNLEQTSQVYEEIHQRLGQYKEIEHVLTNLGSAGNMDTGTNIGSSIAKLVPANKRKLSSKRVAGKVLKSLSDIPNAKISVAAISSGFGEDSGLEFYIQGQETATLEKIKDEILLKIKDIPGILNLDTSTRSGSMVLTVIPKRAEMSAVGATVYDLALALRGAVEGMVSTQYHEDDNVYDIKVSLDETSVDSPDKIQNLTVVIQGQPYLLTQLAELNFEPGTSRITHQDRNKSVVFKADVAEGFSLGKVMAEVNKRVGAYKFPSGYKMVWGGTGEMLNDALLAMLKTFILAILLTYMLLAAILESFVQPIFIMATVPLALVGVILALLISGQTLNLVSMMSVIMLVGIVVNNAILLLGHANMRHKEGISPHDALLEAGEAKLKPIIMSTLAIAIGMLPMALGIGSAGKELRMPMGIVSIGGLLVSAFLTLVIIPAFYYLTTKQKKEEEYEAE